jgi:hypothetical protein
MRVAGHQVSVETLDPTGVGLERGPSDNPGTARTSMSLRRRRSWRSDPATSARSTSDHRAAPTASRSTPSAGDAARKNNNSHARCSWANSRDGQSTRSPWTTCGPPKHFTVKGAARASSTLVLTGTAAGGPLSWLKSTRESPGFGAPGAASSGLDRRSSPAS